MGSRFITPHCSVGGVGKKSAVSGRGSGSAGLLGRQTMLAVEVLGAGHVVGEIDLDAAVVGAEVKGELPLAVVGAEHVGNVALDAVLPDVPLERLEKLPAPLGAEADGAGELAEDGAAQERLGDGPQPAVAAEEHLHVLVVADL